MLVVTLTIRHAPKAQQAGLQNFTTEQTDILMLMQRKRWLLVAVAVATVVAGIILLWSQRAAAPPYAAAKPAPPLTSVAPAFDKQRYSTTDPSSLWVIVNKQHPIVPQGYTPTDLTSVGNGQTMRAEATVALKTMFADAQLAGYTLVADSGYRSYNTQVSTYNGYVQRWGQTYTDTVSARPGYSEHQTGWAVDIGSGSCHVADCFADTPGGKWATANAYLYGFLLRYPPSLTDITGYSNEAWHFRYIGKDLALELHNQHIDTLEQFFNVTGGTTYKT